MYHYLKEAYGTFWGFLYGWACFLVVMSGGIAALAVAFGEYLGSFVPAFSTGNVLFSVPIGSWSWSVSGGQVAGSLAILLMAGLPLAFVTGGLACVFLFLFGDARMLNILPSRIFPLMTDYQLSAIPLFIFMASMLERAGIIEELYDMVPENTHIVVTADHGELFGEAGYFGHGPIMHDKCFEVPYLEGKVR